VRDHNYGVMVLAIVLPLARPGAQEELLSIPEEVQALMEKTSALGSFRLVYRGAPSDESDEGRNATLELTYRAPAHARMMVDLAGEGADLCLRGNRLFLSVRGEGDEGWRSCAVPDSEARRTLDALFPEDKPLECGPSFEMRGGRGVSLSLAFDHSGRDSLFEWFPRMLRRPEGVVRDGERLVWSDGGLELVLSRETGLPEEIHMEHEGEEFALVLESAQIDVDIDSWLELPEEASASEESEELEGVFAHLVSPPELRQRAFLRVERQLRLGTRSWNAETRSDWETFLEAIHGEVITARYSGWIQELRAYADQMASWVRTTLAGGDQHRSVVEEALSKGERLLEEGFSKAEETYAQDLPELDVRALEPRTELFDIERAVVERTLEEQVAEPVLTYFHEQVQAALDEAER
jgi:hypothetical protein